MGKRKFGVDPNKVIDKKNDETPKDTEKITELNDKKTKAEEMKSNSENINTTINKNTNAEDNNKVGRPKGVPSTKISLNVPNDYLDLVNIAAGLNYKGNTSSYINSLIKGDIDKNKALYEQIKEIKQAN